LARKRNSVLDELEQFYISANVDGEDTNIRVTVGGYNVTFWLVQDGVQNLVIINRNQLLMQLIKAYRRRRARKR